MSDSVRPHRRQPNRLPRPWDSPGKNAGVGCHFLLHCMKVKSESEVTQSCPTPSDPMDCSPPGSSVYGIFQARVLEWGAFAFSKGCITLGLSCLALSRIVNFFPILGMFSTSISSTIFSCPFFLSSSSGTPVIRMFGHLTLPQRSLRLSSFLLNLFSFFLYA